MNRGVGKQPQENPTGSRELTSMNKPTEEGHMDPRDVGAVHPAMPQGIKDQGTQISEEAQLATDRTRMRDQCRTQMLLEDAIPQFGVMRIKEKIVSVTRIGGKIQRSNRRAMTLKRGIHEMHRQWLQRLNL